MYHCVKSLISTLNSAPLQIKSISDRNFQVIWRWTEHKIFPRQTQLRHERNRQLLTIPSTPLPLNFEYFLQHIKHTTKGLDQMHAYWTKKDTTDFVAEDRSNKKLDRRYILPFEVHSSFFTCHSKASAGIYSDWWVPYWHIRSTRCRKQHRPGDKHYFFFMENKARWSWWETKILSECHEEKGKGLIWGMCNVFLHTWHIFPASAKREHDDIPVTRVSNGYGEV